MHRYRAAISTGMTGKEVVGRWDRYGVMFFAKALRLYLSFGAEGQNTNIFLLPK